MVRIFQNPANCLQLIRALCAETHEGWLEDHRYLSMDFLKEQKKDLLQTAALNEHGLSHDRHFAQLDVHNLGRVISGCLIVASMHMEAPGS